MKKENLGRFSLKLLKKKEHFPFSGQLELTYRCNLNCVHCYCKGSEGRDSSSCESRSQNDAGFDDAGSRKKELTTAQWKKILDEIQKQGCLWLTLTGGDPLIRDDFLELYAYAKSKGFIITLFTSGQSLTQEIIAYLVKSPPLSIEITLNGITQKTYESITRVPGSFSKVIDAVKKLSGKKLKLILKSNCLKQNKDEISRVKAFTEELLGRPSEKKYRFKYDPMIFPRLNRDKTPCAHRLSFEELAELRKQDPDIWEEYQKGLHSDFPDLKRGRDFLYHCNSWMEQFFIDPFGRLKFCSYSDKFSADLKTTAFKEAFYRWPMQILNERFKTNSKCKDCSLRPICYHCPARAYLETGDEAAPVPYYCELAEETAKQMAVKTKSEKKLKFHLKGAQGHNDGL